MNSICVLQEEGVSEKNTGFYLPHILFLSPYKRNFIDLESSRFWALMHPSPCREGLQHWYMCTAAAFPGTHQPPLRLYCFRHCTWNLWSSFHQHHKTSSHHHGTLGHSKKILCAFPDLKPSESKSQLCPSAGQRRDGTLKLTGKVIKLSGGEDKQLEGFLSVARELDGSSLAVPMAAAPQREEGQPFW